MSNISKLREENGLLTTCAISTNEHDHQRHHEHSQQRSSQTQESHPRYQESGSTTLRMDNTTAAAVLGNQVCSLEMSWDSYLFEHSLTILFYRLKA
jgi:outer membrane biogenesis lipoprotein LolB